MSDQITDNLLARLSIYRENLALLLQRAALVGGALFLPLETQNQIRMTRAEIADLKHKLRGLQAEVDDLPDDTGQEAQPAPDHRRERLLRALLHDHSGFVQDRLDSFVGRAGELAEVQGRIAALQPTGGYVTITGQAGQGKSSLIAKLVELDLRAMLAMNRIFDEPSAINETPSIFTSVTNKATTLQQLEDILNNLLQTQGFEAACHFARSEAPASERAYALCFLAEVCAKKQRWDQVAVLAQETTRAADVIEEVDDRLPVLVAAVRYLLNANREEQAVTLAHQTAALATTGATRLRGHSVLDKILELLLAAQLWETAHAIARTIPNPEQQIEALLTVAKALASAQRSEEAENLARESIVVANAIQNAVNRGFALHTIIEQLLEVQGWQQTVAIVQTVSNAADQVDLLLDIAEHLIKAERGAEAAGLAQTIATATNTITPDWRQSDALWRLTKMLIEAQYYPEAQLAVRTLPDPEDQSRLLKHLAEEMAETEHWDTVAELAHMLAATAPLFEEDWDRREALETSIRMLIAAQRTQAAVDVAHSIRKPSERADALLIAVEELLEAQCFEAALAIAQDATGVTGLIETHGQRRQTQNDIVDLLARHQRFNEAATLVDSPATADNRVGLLQTIIEALIAAQRIDQARPLAQRAVTLARAITDAEQQAMAFCAIAELLVQAQRLGEAQEVAQKAAALAQTIEDKAERTFICCIIADLLLKMQDQSAAIALAQEAALLIPEIAEELIRQIYIDRIIDILHQVQCFEQASNLNHLLRNLSDRDANFGLIANSLTLSRRWEEAIATARNINNTTFQGMMLLEFIVSQGYNHIWNHYNAIIQDTIGLFRADKEITEQLWALAVVTDDTDKLHDLVTSPPSPEGGADEAEEAEAAAWRAAVSEAVTALLTEMQRWEATLVQPETLEHVRAQEDLLPIAIELLTKRQHFEEAISLIKALEDWQQSRALKAITEHLLQAQRFEEAIALANTPEFDRERAPMLASVVERLIQAQRFEEAIALAGPDQKLDVRLSVLHSIAKAAFQGQHLEQADVAVREALAVARTIADPIGQARALGVLVQTLSVIQYPEQASAVMQEALALARTIADPLGQVQTLAALAHMLVQSQRSAQAMAVVREALEVANTIADPYKQAQILNQLAETLIAAHGSEQTSASTQEALAIARSINDTDARRRVLSAVGQALIQAHQWEPAAACINEVLSMTSDAASGLARGWRTRIFWVFEPSDLLVHVAQLTHTPTVLAIVQQQWARAAQRADLLALLPAAAPLFLAEPGLLDEVLAGFGWVQEQLVW